METNPSPTSPSPFQIPSTPLFVVEYIPRTLPPLQPRILNYSRKERSLEQLSKRFINQFQGKQDAILELEKVTLQLSVERRRVYDVINILESLHVVKKASKGRYQWYGLKEALSTIQHYETTQDLQEITIEYKGEKSLQYLAAGFLKLFLKAEIAISLEIAAKKLLSAENQQVVKTKVRRLYDIVNVFKSLGCVRKIILDKKPAFQWIGTDKLEKIIIEKRKGHEKGKAPPSTSLTLASEIQLETIPPPKQFKPQFNYLMQYRSSEYVTKQQPLSPPLFNFPIPSFPFSHNSRIAFTPIMPIGKDR